MTNSYRTTLAALALLGCAPAAIAQVTATNGTIAYTVCQFNAAVGAHVCDIWSMNPDGSGQTNLTNTPTISEWQPAWSADGTRLAYMRGGLGGHVLAVMNADGTAATDITPASVQNGPTWSPDGTRIAVSREVPGTTISIQYDIVVVNVNGSGEANITTRTDGLDFDEIEPAWSPDGAKIAFAAVRFEQSEDPITGLPITLAQYEIVTVNPDGSGEQILSVGDPGSIRARLLEEDRAPAWSPDGQSLVFMSQSVDPCCTPWQIWSVASNGTGATVVSDNPAVDDMWPSYSPDGTLIVFSSTRDSTTGQSDIYTLPAAGAGLAVERLAASATRLTSVGTASDPHWARQPGTEPPLPPSLTVTLSLVGTHAGGLVASLPPGIFCGRDCAETYAKPTAVLLVAVPRIGSRFAGWSGACTGRTFYCVVKVDGPKTVTAVFARR